MYFYSLLRDYQVFRLNIKLFQIELFRIHHALTTTIVIVVQRWFYRNCLWLTSRGIVVYIVLNPAALIFYLFCSWLSPLIPNLVSRNLYTNVERARRQQLTEIVVLNVCAVVQAYIVSPISPWPYLQDKKKSLNKFCGKEASVLLYMYVKYRIFTQNIYKIFVNFLRGILAFQRNDKSFARDLYQSNLSDKTRKTYNQINIILTHCQVNKIKNVTVCYSVLLLKKTKKNDKIERQRWERRPYP